jgi:ATP-dependent Zn protease
MPRKTKAKRERHNLERTAYHEAGHAVVAMKLNQKFHHVTIEPEEGSLGHILHDKLSRRFRPDVEMGFRTREKIENHCLISMAGMAAESKFIGSETWEGGGSDKDRAIVFASYLYFDSEIVGPYILFMRARADSLMRSARVWSQVEAVAAALLEHRTLTWDRVEEIYKAAMFPGRPDLAAMSKSLAEDLSKMRNPS